MITKAPTTISFMNSCPHFFETISTFNTDASTWPKLYYITLSKFIILLYFSKTTLKFLVDFFFLFCLILTASYVIVQSYVLSLTYHSGFKASLVAPLRRLACCRLSLLLLLLI